METGRPRLLTYPGQPNNRNDNLAPDQRSKSNNLKDGANGGGNESPESGSLYSDEIPSGYNSGEQYDTISCGYMSGEAYELPETRMELREPALEVIEECIQPLGALNADSDENVFKMPDFSQMGTRTPDGGNSTLIDFEQGENDNSSTSSGGDDKAEADSILNMVAGSPYGKKHRKKPLTFAIPIEASPLKEGDESNGIYDESSDAGMGDAPTGGYRAVPSDTDTSAVDSDPNDGRHKRRRKKNLKNHDEAWFHANDTKTWSRLRFLCFWGSICCMVGACVTAGILIFLMPRNCDPAIDWYQGKVIVDIHPSSIQDLPGFDLPQYKDVGVTSLHLKWKNIDTISNHVEQLTNAGDKMEAFFDRVHEQNLTIIVQIPIKVTNETKPKMDLDLEHQVENAIRFWISAGADGVFLDGLENYEVDAWMAPKIINWHGLLDRYAKTASKSKVLMTSYKFAHEITEKLEAKEAEEALAKINLLDAHLDLNVNITNLEATMEDITHWDTIKGRPWINWNIETSGLQMSNAAIALQMLLPGTINLNGIQGGEDETMKNMTTLRALAVPIFMNGNYKRCDCDEGLSKEVNYAIHQPVADLIQLERYYSRRNRYVLVANFGEENVNLVQVGKIYAGGELVLDTSKSLPDLGQELVKFSDIALPPGEAVVIKLPK